MAKYIPPYKYITGSSLSKNSIVVGAINTNQDQIKLNIVKLVVMSIMFQ